MCSAIMRKKPHVWCSAEFRAHTRSLQLVVNKSQFQRSHTYIHSFGSVVFQECNNIVHMFTLLTLAEAKKRTPVWHNTEHIKFLGHI